MAVSVGKIGLDLVVNQKSFNKQMHGIKGLAKKVGAVLASAFAVKKLVDFGKQCVELGSDLAEVQNVVDVTFPAMSAQVDEFAKNAATSFGLSETMAKQFTGTFGAMAKAFGFSEQQAYDMSTTLTGLAGDVASFYNITQDEAYTKLKSVFTGETESLKDLGVVMTQTALDAYAMANGYGKTTSAMSEAEKVALRYAFVQDQLSAAAGDFSRTSGGWANQVRVLNLQFDSLKSTIGQGLISALTPVLKVINAMISELQVLADAFKNLMEGVFGKQDTSGVKAVSSAAQTAADAADATAASTGATANNLKKSSKFLAGFDVINKVDSSESTSEKTTGGSEGASGTSGITIPKTAVPAQSGRGAESASKLAAILAPLQKISLDPLKKSLEGLWGSVKNFGSDIWAGLQWGYEKILIPLSTWVIEDGLPAFLDALSSGIDFCSQVIEAAAPYFSQFFDNVLAPLADFVGDAIVRFWEDIGFAFDFFTGVLRDNPELGAIIAAIATSIGLVAAKMAIVNLLTSMNPFGLIAIAVAALIAVIGELVRNWDTIETTANNVWNSIKAAWSAAGTWFKTKVVDPVAGFFKNLWDGIKTKAENCWNGVLRLFSSGGRIFSGIRDGISNVFRTIVNSLISGINTVIAIPFNKINGLLNQIKNINILGAKPFSGLWSTDPLPVPQIPKLAQGGYVKANTPQLAMIGDNRHQGEVVAPEDKLQEMVDLAVQRAGQAGINREEVSLLRKILELLQERDWKLELNCKGSIESLIRLLYPYIEQERKRRGISLVD